MIVKNEAHCIAACLESVRSIVDEIIIADTGSEDQTVLIAESFGAHVFSFAWCDDFAAARNATIARATKEWILILDADEVIASSDLSALQARTKDRTICTEFMQRHYTNDVRLSDFTPCRGAFPELERHYAGYFESNCVRLFPNHEGLLYHNRIHELVEPSIYALKKHTIERTSIRIHHYGHTPEIQALKKKHLLYTPLGVKKAEEDPTDWKAFYELGVERNVHATTVADREASVAAFKRSLALHPEYVPTWVNMGYVLMELGRFQESLDACKEALRRDPKNADAYCNIGVIGLRTGDMKLAERATLSAIERNPSYVNALRNLVKIYCQTGRLSEAALVCTYVLSFVPQFPPALADLGMVYLQGRELKSAEKYLQQSLAFDPRNPETLFHLGQLAWIQQQYEHATQYLTRLLEVAPGFVLPADMRAFMSKSS